MKVSNWNKQQMTSLIVVIALFFNALSPAYAASSQSAFDVYQMMYDQTINLEAREITVPGSGTETPISFGAEKEGSSAKIVRVMSPSKGSLFQFLNQNHDFSRTFIPEFLAGQHRVQNVIDLNGKAVALKEPSYRLKNFNWKRVDTIELKNVISDFVEMFPRSPFSFIDMESREVLLNKVDSRGRQYETWDPLIGEPEKYIEGASTEANAGWEINFKPQKTYADFEKMQTWFRKLMGSRTELFEAPGHQRVVMPMIKFENEVQQLEFQAKAAEVSRVLRTYMILDSIARKTNYISGEYADLVADRDLFSLKNDRRGPIRLETDRFYENSVGVEFRMRMGNERTRRFAHAIYASRLATNDMKDLVDLRDYELFDHTVYKSMYNIAVRFELSADTVEKALNNFEDTIPNHKGNRIRPEYNMPLWNWDKAPFLQGKKDEIKRISREYIKALAAMKNPSTEKITQLLADWVVASDIKRDIERYLTPKQNLETLESPLEVKIKPGGFDVNKIDLGNEFTARMPLKLKAEYDKDHNWKSTVYDMTPKSRKAKILSVAQSIKENLTGSRKGVTALEQGSHGHSLSIAFTFKDKQNRDWRVEWDGVTRNYDENGNVIEKSVRGGHIEIVSPKYNPTMNEIQAVYDAMNTEGVIPEYKMGGSHINIDFEPFENRPEVMARFLSLFHKHRGIIAFMFQHANRLRSAEPVEVSAEFDKKLRNFKGTKAELSALLYDNQYFNTRTNRKTRYTQIDVSNYMADVIPENFVLQDFDVVKARMTGGTGWTQQFRVTNAKKLEMRLFDAAATPAETAMQIRLVRALLNKAMNDTSPIEGPVQNVDYEKYLRDPQQAMKDLGTLATELDLKVADYTPYVYGKFDLTRAFMNSKFYRNWKSYADETYPKVKNWGKASAPRSDKAPLYSTGRVRCEMVFH